MRALQIRSEPLERILKGEKTWEIRGSPTKIREQIGLIESGSGTVVGVCELVGCVGPLTQDEATANQRKTGRVSGSWKLGYYKSTYAWVLENPRPLRKPCRTAIQREPLSGCS